MVSVVLIWSYMLLTMFPVGYGVLHLLIGKRGYRVRYAGSYLMRGMRRDRSRFPRQGVWSACRVET